MKCFFLILQPQHFANSFEFAQKCSNLWFQRVTAVHCPKKIIGISANNPSMSQIEQMCQFCTRCANFILDVPISYYRNCRCANFILDVPILYYCRCANFIPDVHISQTYIVASALVVTDSFFLLIFGYFLGHIYSTSDKKGTSWELTTMCNNSHCQMSRCVWLNDEITRGDNARDTVPIVFCSCSYLQQIFEQFINGEVSDSTFLFAFYGTLTLSLSHCVCICI